MANLSGSRDFRSDLYTPGKLQHHRAGVAVCEQTPVTQMARTAVGWDISTPKGRLSAGKVILANNGQIESCGFAVGRLMHVFLYASMTPELSAEEVKRRPVTLPMTSCAAMPTAALP
jgi:glycine/D-amino acid oxidase-like deaminating enzyme